MPDINDSNTWRDADETTMRAIVRGLDETEQRLRDLASAAEEAAQGGHAGRDHAALLVAHAVIMAALVEIDPHASRRSPGSHLADAIGRARDLGANPRRL